jgi:hypothetical protein
MPTNDFTGHYPAGITLSAGGNTSATIESSASVSGDTAFLTEYSLAVQNSGTITGGTYGVSLYGGTFTNSLHAQISASLTGVFGQPGGGPVTIANAGTISGNNGVFLYGGSLLTNSATGSITGSNTGVYSNGVVINAGAIGGADAVILGGGGSLTNSAGGSITGSVYGVYTSVAGNVTVENAGTISGTTDSIDFSDKGVHTLIVDAGAVFNGNIVANSAGTNTLELSATGGSGTISDLGTKYQGFQTITIDSGASWTVAGTIAGFHGATIHGFGMQDTLDLKNLAYSSGDTATLNGSDLLTVKDAGGETLANIQLSGDFTDDFFHLADDGHGGSYVTENDSPPCYCLGTLVLTDRGQAAVEDLQIGDRLITASGVAMPLKWIGRRGYRGWAARRNDQAQPIRFKAGSIADGIPARDLLVSPEHAMFLDGMLIPARHLVNGVSILKTTGMDDIQYFHLELDEHAVIVAEGALSESFADDNSRGMFHNASEFRMLYPNQPHRIFAQFCAPRVEDGAELESVRCRLSERAALEHAADGSNRGAASLGAAA